MIVELHINGKLSLELTPETDIERLVLSQMSAGAAKGKAVSLRTEADPRIQDERYVVEVER